VVERVYLVGMMGSGKSSVGALLARRLGWRFLDLDAEVERSVGKSVADIFADGGEASFRAHERRFVASAATGDTPAVVAVGGGAVTDSDNRRRMSKSGTVIWMRARDDTLIERVATGTGRPLLAGDPSEALRRLHSRRRPLYAEVSDIVIDVDGLSQPEVADRMLAALHRFASRAGERPR
jgi:shikimate kinase